MLMFATQTTLGRRVVEAFNDVMLLALVIAAIPVAILAIGTPVGLLIWLVTSIVRSW
jgi:hypothetical protein